MKYLYSLQSESEKNPFSWSIKKTQIAVLSMNVSGLALEENPIIINLKIDSVTKTFLIPNDVLQVLSIENRKKVWTIDMI